MTAARLHRGLAAGMALAAIAAFTSGAGLEPSVLVAVPLLLLSAFWSPSPERMVRLETPLRVVALVLAARAIWLAFAAPAAVITPMVDLLLFLMCGEALRVRDTTGDARLFSLSLALLVAGAAYRPGPGFALGLALFLALTTMCLAVGHTRRQAEAHGRAAPAIRTGVLARLGMASALALAVGVLVFMVFPRHARGWAGRPAEPSRIVVGFSDVVGLGAHGATIEANPAVALRVQFPDGVPETVADLYWRGRSYDRFDGIRWSRSRLPRPMPVRPAEGTLVRQVIRSVPLETPVAFGLEQPVRARPRARLTLLRDEHGDLTYRGRVAPAYEILSRTDVPSADSLRRTAHALPPGGVHFLQVPAVSARLRALSDSLTAGASNDYDRAVAIERWLRTTFAYTLDLPATAPEATLEHFLFERREGHCEYFSTAMTVLLRVAGVPARNVNGFRGGDWNSFGDYLAVTQNQAHSWVEAWFPGAGWVSFDPTPAADDAGILTGGSLGPLRRLLDGLAFRWGTWVLDYDLDDQTAILARAFRPGEAPRADPFGPVLWLAAVVVFLVGAATLLRRPRLPAETRAWRRLRRAYAAAGFVAEGPRGLAAVLTERNAPGAADAVRAIGLYLAARFGPGDGRAEREAMRAAVTDALRSLRR